MVLGTHLLPFDIKMKQILYSDTLYILLAAISGLKAGGFLPGT
jgi:hypothetical protein